MPEIEDHLAGLVEIHRDLGADRRLNPSEAPVRPGPEPDDGAGREIEIHGRSSSRHAVAERPTIRRHHPPIKAGDQGLTGARPDARALFMLQLALSGRDEAHAIEACVLDAYGTLLDVHSALAAVLRVRGEAGGRGMDAGTASALSLLWRRKQLAYSWLRSLMRHHADFAAVTADALDFALAAHGLDGDPALRAELLRAYERLAPYPEVPDVLARLAAAGLPLAVLSNGTPEMLETALAHAGIARHLDAVLSIEAIGVFKPAPEVYALATRRLGIPAPRILFLSSNGWDVHGAASFGFATIHVDRQKSPPERLPGRPLHRIADLRPLPGLLGLETDATP